jgi:putative flippase GtrA
MRPEVDSDRQNVVRQPRSSLVVASRAWKYRPSSATTHGQMLRFLVFGGVNTLISTVAFYGLATVTPPRVAWTIIYVVGIAFVALTTPRFVFGSRATWLRRLLFAGWYFCTYLVGIGVISLLTSAFSASRIVVVLVTVAVTAPLGFIGGRLLVSAR